MAEDWAKLIADAKKLETKIKDYTLDDATDLWKAVQARDKSLEAHEKSLQKAAIAAYEAGVGSKKVAEFQKDKGFAAAFKLLDTDRKLLIAELTQLETLCEKCKSAARLVEDQLDVMDRALVASKKEKSAERSAAKKVRDGLYERFGDLTAASNLRFKPDKYLTDFDKNFDKIIDHLIAEAFKKGKDPVQAEVPQPLSEKKLAEATKEAVKGHKVVTTCCTKMAALDSGSPAFALLSDKGYKALEDLVKLAEEYEALVKKFKAELAAADPKDDVKDKVAVLRKHYDDAKAELVKASNPVGKVK